MQKTQNNGIIPERIVTPLWNPEGGNQCQQNMVDHNDVNDVNDDDDDDGSELIPRELPFPTASMTQQKQTWSNATKGEEEEAAPVNVSICTEPSRTNSLDLRIQNLFNDLDVNHLDQDTLHLIEKVNSLSQEKSSVYENILPSLVSILEQRLGNHALRTVSHSTRSKEGDGDPNVVHSHSQMVRLEQEHKQLRNIIRDLGYASLLPDYIHRDDDSSLVSSSLSLCSVPEHYIYAQHQQIMPHHVRMHPPHTIHEQSISHQSEDYHSMDHSQHYYILQKQMYQYQGEIQSLHAQIDSLSSENARLHSDVHELTQQRDHDKQHSKNLEMELHQVSLAKTETWRELNQTLEEKLKTERDMVALRQENESLKYTLSKQEEELDQVRHQMHQLEEDVQNRIRDTMEMEQRWNGAKEEVQSLSANLTASDIDQQKLKESLRSANDHVHNLEEQLTKLQRRCASHDAQYTEERSRISSIEKERNSMKSILEEERRKSDKLREDLADSVAREAVASEQIKTLLKEKTSLATQLNLATARNTFGNKTSSLLAKSPPVSSYRNRLKSLDSSNKFAEKEIPTEESTVEPSITTQDAKENEAPISHEIILESSSSTLLDYISNDDDDSLALL